MQAKWNRADQKKKTHKKVKSPEENKFMSIMLTKPSYILIEPKTLLDSGHRFLMHILMLASLFILFE